MPAHSRLSDRCRRSARARAAGRIRRRALRRQPRRSRAAGAGNRHRVQRAESDRAARRPDPPRRRRPGRYSEQRVTPRRRRAQPAPAPRSRHDRGPRHERAAGRRRRRAATRPARLAGHLVVRSTPSRAAVTVNGRWRGRTPLTLDALPFGNYVVRVVQDGYDVAREEVTLSARRRVAHDRRAPRTEGARRRGLRPSRRSRRRRRRAGPGVPPLRAATPARPYTGSLYVDSRPRGATVLVDGKSVGETPLSLPEVPVGSHVVRIEMAGKKPWTTSARVSWPARWSASPVRSRTDDKKSMKATLALENGIWYEGDAAGAPGETGGEVVFNTSMSGYQEILTDPSYAGQIVTMTAPEMGNYGTSAEDSESRGTQVAGFVVREESPIASNWRSDSTLRDYLIKNNIVAISNIDTRALVRVLRSAGVMRGIIATGDVDPRELVDRAQGLPSMEGSDLVLGVTCERAFDWTPATPLAEDEFAPPVAAQDAAQPARRRLRLRDEVEHPAPLHRLRLRRARVPGDGAGVGADRAPARTASS